MDNLPASYALDDVFPSVRDGLSVDGKLFALPFYAESSITYYRKDLFKAAGLTMPERPTWTQISEFADKLTDKSKEQYGICLRGKAGWGENMALITTVANSFGARWFDEQWKPQFDQPEWKNALTFYTNVMKKDGPPGASSNGFNENLALFNSGKCAIWVDASVAGSFVTDKAQSKVADSVGFTYAPHEVTDKGSAWLYSWALAIPTSAKNDKDARAFTEWATSKEYASLVAEKDGVSNVPPGTRASTYTDAYKKAAPFADITLESLKAPLGAVAAGLDDRATGHDHLFFADSLQPAQSRRKRICRPGELRVFRHRRGLSPRGHEYPAAGGQRAGHQRHTGQPDFPPGLGHPCLGLEAVRRSAHRLAGELPDAVDHHHRVVAVAAVRHSDSDDRHAVAGSGAERSSTPGWRRPDCDFLAPDPAPPGASDCRGGDDRNHLPALGVRRNLHHHQRRAGFCFHQSGVPDLQPGAAAIRRGHGIGGRLDCRHDDAQTIPSPAKRPARHPVVADRRADLLSDLLDGPDQLQDRARRVCHTAAVHLHADAGKLPAHSGTQRLLPLRRLLPFCLELDPDFLQRDDPVPVDRRAGGLFHGVFRDQAHQGHAAVDALHEDVAAGGRADADLPAGQDLWPAGFAHCADRDLHADQPAHRGVDDLHLLQGHPGRDSRGLTAGWRDHSPGDLQGADSDLQGRSGLDGAAVADPVLERGVLVAEPHVVQCGTADGLDCLLLKP
nr:hypothetical protein [Tanacetum cinerariifolium]